MDEVVPVAAGLIFGGVACSGPNGSKQRLYCLLARRRRAWQRVPRSWVFFLVNLGEIAWPFIYFSSRQLRRHAGPEE
jgi:hypothetical protein